ncbi:MAG: hypothetical protein JXA92_02225 [candidate division Zixibacteria bacterium]|nr:hypothetical protein [candidate division Zixibacteria bacterium]
MPFRAVRARRPKLPRPTVSTAAGTAVRSRYEKKAVEYFRAENIEFLYEPLLLLDGKKYRPDFFLPAFDLFVEICGYGLMPHYRDRIAFKKQLYKKHDLRVIFITYNGRGSLEKLIEKELADYLKKQGKA